jgi:high-affinity nickel-transport protein
MNPHRRPFSKVVEDIANRLPPRLRVLSWPAIRMISCVSLVNILVWVGVAFDLRYNPKLSSSAVLSYTLGLRHALDADHISAIDLMTRRLVASGSKPVTVGLWFSLGHSTIVCITCIVVAATSGALQDRFEGFRNVGGIIGTAVASAVLILLGIGNAWILMKLIQKMRQVLKEEVSEDRQEHPADSGLPFEGGGIFFRLFRKIFKFVDKPWKMYPLGVLFGLGFDTSSEIAVLGIASIQAIQGTSIWLILIFPVLFTAGMCLLDTTDGALMMTLYTSTPMARDRLATLYYSIVLTALTILVAICIGTIQLLTLIENATSAEGPFWDGVNAVGEHYDIVGGAICGAFVLTGVAGALLYKPWRRRVERRKQRARGVMASVELKVGEPNEKASREEIQQVLPST